MIWFEYIIESGQIINAIEYDGNEPYDPGEGKALIEKGESEAWVGWVYDGENFINPNLPDKETLDLSEETPNK